MKKGRRKGCFREIIVQIKELRVLNEAIDN